MLVVAVFSLIPIMYMLYKVNIAVQAMPTVQNKYINTTDFKTSMQSQSGMTTKISDSFFVIIYFGSHLVLFVSAWVIPMNTFLFWFIIIITAPTMIFAFNLFLRMWEIMTQTLGSQFILATFPMTNFLIGNIVIAEIVMLMTYFAILFSKGRQG
jgi:hypothetical protein